MMSNLEKNAIENILFYSYFSVLINLAFFPGTGIVYQTAQQLLH